MQHLIKIASGTDVQGKVIYIQNEKMIVARGNVCLRGKLGEFIDILWDKDKGNVLLATSNS